MPLHQNLTGAALHEPKGVAGASSNTLYHADGSGSGTWKKSEAAQTTVLDTAGYLSASNVEDALSELFEGAYLAYGVFADVSTASTILIPVPFDCEVSQINFVLGGTISTADASIAVSRSDGASMGSEVITASGSAEGTTFEFVPTGNATLTYATHKYIKLVSDGGSTNAIPLYVVVNLKRT